MLMRKCRALLSFALLSTICDSFSLSSSLSSTRSPSSIYATTQDQEKLDDISAITNRFLKDNEDRIDKFCRGTNEFWKGLVIEPVRNYVEVKPAGSSESDILSKLTAPPEVPGISRPVWLTILGSVPTALGWYGYYKFSVEEELFQYEVQNGKKVSGCGGYGTLFPFVYGILIGGACELIGLEVGNTIIEAAALWILLGQVNLYRRVNELCEEEKEKLGLTEPPLHAWWALLPPPLDVVVGLRQVHYLSEYWRVVRGDPYEKDVIAEDLFPFISSERFTLKEFVLQPKRWFWFTTNAKDIEL
ncbi:hypothetical protein CTEN210_17067 [Chaetoceros tenuissimus]|uniref:Uncharacterized protein n=1 Tax=Chaetoceros tenuissimus TaxID=426638 RepID=A0AAD3DC61_9STRA|nr:hypothetical protein CTEN210_17067 [Chaetoceros tenuissimus]